MSDNRNRDDYNMERAGQWLIDRGMYSSERQDSLEKQLNAADLRGYERGVREERERICAQLRGDHADSRWGPRSVRCAIADEIERQG